MSDAPLTRRALLEGAVLASPGLGLLLRSVTGRAARAADCAQLAALVPALAAAPELGRACARLLPEGGVAERLCAALTVDLADLRAPAEPRVLGEALRARMARDFQEGRTLRVDGWLLSRTEVRLAALLVAAPV